MSTILRGSKSSLYAGHEHFTDESIIAPTGVPIEWESPFYPTSAPGIVVEEITMEEWKAARVKAAE